MLDDKELEDAIAQEEKENKDTLDSWVKMNQERKKKASVPNGIFVRTSDCQRVKVVESSICGLTSKEQVVFVQLFDKPVLWTMPVDIFRNAYIEEEAFIRRYLN